MSNDEVVVKFNEALRELSKSVKEMTDIGYEISFNFHKNKLTVMRDGQVANTMYVDTPKPITE